MARKSRRDVSTVAAVAPIECGNTYSTAIYARLSIENSGKDDDGDSIANQISFCKDYMSGQPDLKLYSVYEDNGEKGTNFDRPQFQKLMEDVRTGKVQCIVVKDLSRFGRDYIEAGQYLEKIFPFLGIRFISITDGYDSLTSKDAEGALMIPLKNMINDVYAKDISRKIITSFRARQENAEFLPAFAPYGYVKSKTDAYRYEVDMEVAPYVRMIYEWKAAGVSHNEISERLNAMGAVTPATHKYNQGIWHHEKYKHTTWYGRTIIDILKNPTYTGCIVYGRMPKSLYQGIKIHRATPDEWRIIPDMHEPIVSKELFDKVQSIFEERSKVMAKKHAKTKEIRESIPNIFKNRIYCGDCGKRMRFVRHKDKRTDDKYISLYYICGGFRDSHYEKCSRHHIGYDAVCDAVYSVIKTQLEVALEEEKLLKRLKGTKNERNLMDMYNGQINYLSQEFQKINTKRESLYENYTEGLLDADEYQFAKQSYDAKAEEIQIQLKAAREKKHQLERVLSDGGEWLAALRKVEQETAVNQDMVNEMVNKICVYEDGRVEVVLNYADEKKIYKQIVNELSKGAV